MKKLLILAIVPILACKCRPNDPPPPNDNQKPVCSISVDASSVSTTSATVNFSASDNVTVINTTLTLNGGAPIGVTGQTVYSFIGLTPNTGYTVTLTAKDAAGNVGTASTTFTTLALPPQNSSWFAQPTITYSSPISGMIGNTNSGYYKITLPNTSSTPQMLRSLRINFGTTAIKMQRTQTWASPDGTGWEKITAINGTVIFNDLWLNPGITELKAVFSLKENVGVPNGTSISISFDQMLDAQGGVLPIGGSWQSAVNAGTIDANTQATKLTTEWLGYMAQSPVTIAPNGTATLPNYNVTNVKVSGPSDARVASIKLRNPYGNALIWNNSSWKINLGGPDYVVSANWNGDYVKLSMPNEAIISNTSLVSFTTFSSIQNASTTMSFNSGTITPGLYGLELKSKYDLEILNSNGQLIDLSDVVVKQGANVVQN